MSSSGPRLPPLVALALGATALPLTAQDTVVAALAGTWVGHAVHGGDSTPVALTLAPDAGGALGVVLFLPVIHVRDVPVGRVRRDGLAVRLGPVAVTWDSTAGTLTGLMPAGIVPVHRVPVTLRRGTLPAFPTRPGAEVPRVGPAWTFDAGAAVWADLTAAGDLVLVGADDGRLHALDARTGAQRWTFQAGGAIRAAPAVYGGALYLHADDGMLYRLDAATGAARWRVRTTDGPITRVPPPGPDSRWDTRGSGVAMAQGVLVVGTHDGRVLALDTLDGARRWTFAAGGSVVATPAAAAGRVFAGSFDGKVYALDAATGARLWERDTGAPVTSTPTPAGPVVVVGSRSYDLFGLDVATGAVRWIRYVWFSWIESTPALADGVAYVGSSDAARIMALEAASGRRVWDADVLGASWGTPVVTGGTVFVGTRGQAGAFTHAAAVVALDRATGRMRWRYPVTAPDGAAFSGFAGSPAAAAGHVVFGAVDGRVYGFDTAAAAGAGAIRGSRGRGRGRAASSGPRPAACRPAPAGPARPPRGPRSGPGGHADPDRDQGLVGYRPSAIGSWCRRSTIRASARAPENTNSAISTMNGLRIMRPENPIATAMV
jgi:outer membrane protein assembly factor BamB